MDFALGFRYGLHKIKKYLTGWTPEDFELLVEVDGDGQIQLVDRVLHWFLNCEDVVNSDGNVVFISVVGDENSGKSTLLDHIHYRLKDLQGDIYYSKIANVFPTKTWKAEQIQHTNGVLLKTKPASVRCKDGTVVKVFLIDIWSSPKNPMTDGAYTKLVDFCTAVSTIVYYISKDEGSYDDARRYKIIPDQSIMKLLPQEIYQHAAFCFFNWPYEPRSRESNPWVRRLYQFLRVGDVEFRKWDAPALLPVTSRIIQPALEASKRFQHNYYYTCTKCGTRSNEYEVLVARLMFHVIKPENLIPVAGEKGYREAKSIKELLQQAMSCINRMSDVNQSSAFMKKKAGILSKPTSVIVGNKTGKADPLAIFRSRPHLVPQLRVKYWDSLAQHVISELTDELFFSFDELFEFHQVAAKTVLEGFEKANPNLFAEETVSVIVDHLHNWLKMFAKQKVEIESVVQELMNDVILLYNRRIPRQEVLKEICKYENKLKRDVSSLPEVLEDTGKYFMSAKVESVRSSYLFLLECRSYCEQTLETSALLEGTGILNLRQNCERSIGRKNICGLPSGDQSFDQFVNLETLKIFAAVKDVYENRRQQEIVLAKVAAEHVRKVYNAKMDVACNQTLFDQRALESLHEDLKDRVLQAYFYTNFSNSVWKDQIENLKYQLDQDFRLHFSEHSQLIMNVLQNSTMILEKAQNVFDFHMSAVNPDYSRKTKRAYFDARDQALEVFNNDVSNQQGSLVKYWKAHLTDALERKYTEQYETSTAQPTTYARETCYGSVNLKKARMTEEETLDADSIAISLSSHYSGSKCEENSDTNGSINLSAGGGACDEGKFGQSATNLITSIDKDPHSVQPQYQENPIEIDDHPLRHQLRNLINEMRQKLETSGATRPMKKKITLLVDAADHVLLEDCPSDARIKQSLDQLLIWEKHLM